MALNMDQEKKKGKTGGMETKGFPYLSPNLY